MTKEKYVADALDKTAITGVPMGDGKVQTSD